MDRAMGGYIRVSRVGSREGDSFISPKVQREKIEAWCRLHDADLAEVVEELDVSGGVAPAERRLERLLVACEAGRLGGVVTWRVDRFSRSAADTLAAVKRLQACGARLVGVDDGVDTDQQGGKLVLTVLAGLAESQLDQARENWRMARSEASKRGVWLGGHAPTGYARDPDTRALVLESGAAPAVREAFLLRARGGSFQQAADLLSERGVLPRAGLRKDGVERTRWGREGARQLLRNPVYKGEPGGSNHGAEVEVIVTSEEWAAAQAPGRSYPTGNGRTRALLLGVIRCGGCGHALHATGRGPSYSCRGKFASGTCPSRAFAHTARVDEYVVQRILDEPDGTFSGAATAEARHLKARAVAERAEAELDVWVEDATLRGRLGEERWRRGLDSRADALDRARVELWEAPDPGIPEGALVVELGGRRMLYERFGEDVDADRRWVRRYVERVVLRRADPARRKHQPIEERVEIVWRTG